MDAAIKQQIDGNPFTPGQTLLKEFFTPFYGIKPIIGIYNIVNEEGCDTYEQETGKDNSPLSTIPYQE
jgi:hypothetical protein